MYKNLDDLTVRYLRTAYIQLIFYRNKFLDDTSYNMYIQLNAERVTIDFSNLVNDCR